MLPRFIIQGWSTTNALQRNACTCTAINLESRVTTRVVQAYALGHP